VRYAFLDLATRDPRRYVVIDASASEAEIAAQIAARVHSMLPAEAEADPAAAQPGHGSAPLTEGVPDPPPASALGEYEPPLWTDSSPAITRQAGNDTAAPSVDDPVNNADLPR
jgi:dTMP kinase